ncbi:MULTISPECIES: hypothetical protein [unclassified Paenibacillus]|uniref:hypothetical protein n=1 Tax=unclassified Paenibacillus TaxID=185978 RepID=UPI001AE92700|nr:MULTISPECIES: hypothetical protein [unclassified Paenibacillus]MBP1153726.1 hypothetical protein [Paenibacillus sp. PvP091]MBP1170889.1 hypothetical protein [Paenibacillus sp. PvR098]MBP2441917.1 hypothetical protein [Paenibacillus sp. PvP052]
MNLELEQMTQWLEQCRGQQLLIEKREQDDRDLIKLRLERVSLGHPALAHADDYIAESELVLHGVGSIIFTHDHSRLPENQYEIPLLGNWRGSVQEDGLQLVTDRAEYTISKKG